MTMVLAAMTLFGRAAWSLPRRLLGALPELDIEGNRIASATREGSADAVSEIDLGAAAPSIGFRSLQA